jgi:hypothetical protein
MEALKIMDYEYITYFNSLNQHFHPRGLYTYKHLKEQKNSTLFYRQPWQFSKAFSYQWKAQWELFHKSRDFSTNI